jgi:ABC-2 type transport system permease protein
MRFKPRLGGNPIIVKELRSRMRGARAFAILTGVLLLLGAVSYVLYRIMLSTLRYTNLPISPQIGQMLFMGLAFLELMMVCFITPAVTAGALSSEREKLTYEMLLTTPLRPASILWGKLVSALSYVFLLIFAAVPMASLVFIFGGVSPRDMIKALVILVAVSVTLGVVGIFMSIWLGRTGRATVLSYLVVLAILIAPGFVYIAVAVLRQAEPPAWILIPNPVSALFSALTPVAPSGGTSEIFWGLSQLLGGNLGTLTGSATSIPRPLYHYTLPLYGAITLLLYLLSTRLVRPTRRWRLGWKEMLAAVALFLLLGGAVALAFGATASRYELAGAGPMPTPFPVVPVPVVIEKEVVQAVPVAPPPLPPTPAPTEPPVATPTPPLPEDDQVAIYAAVIRQPPYFPLVYLVQITDDAAGHPSAPQAEPRWLPESVQTAIVAALADFSAEFRWVKDAAEAPRTEDTGEVKGNGAIVTLGNIHPQADGSVLVSVRLDFSDLARGKTFIVQKVEGAWQVVGDTRATWTSY